MSEKFDNRIAQASDSKSTDHLSNGMWAKGGDMQSIHLQAQTPKYDNSVSLPKLELTGTVTDNNVKYNGSTNGGTRQVHEAHASTSVGDAGASKSHYHSAYDNPPPVEHRPQPQQAHATADGAGFHTWKAFPPKRDANGNWHQPGMLDIYVKPGLDTSNAQLGDLEMPAIKGRSNHYNYLGNARYEDGKLIGTPEHRENGQVTDSYPGEVSVKCRK